ncbi:MAG: hypothetical protein FWC50_15060 [Planctomycetaceae bacterium]|nr:hypothetical protein [Planctomycetaceae bacterium]
MKRFIRRRYRSHPPDETFHPPGETFHPVGEPFHQIDGTFHPPALSQSSAG